MTRRKEPGVADAKLLQACRTVLRKITDRPLPSPRENAPQVRRHSELRAREIVTEIQALIAEAVALTDRATRYLERGGALNFLSWWAKRSAQIPIFESKPVFPKLRSDPGLADFVEHVDFNQLDVIGAGRALTDREMAAVAILFGVYVPTTSAKSGGAQLIVATKAVHRARAEASK